MLNGKCIEPQIPGYQFESHYDCALAGYAMSQQSLKMLSTDEYYGIERINQERLAIRFECRQLEGA